MTNSGSGKTYLAAFDALNFAPNRLLYIVHEGSILRKSMETFAEVFGNDITMGEYSDESKELDVNFVFSTNVSMAKSLELFDRKEFDYIIIDECHRAAADTYRKIIGYFEPEFLLGLTATPERMDNQDIFELFDQNVPYELRLRDAIINDLVVPFKYYGIRDKESLKDLHEKYIRHSISEYNTIDKFYTFPGFVPVVDEQIEYEEWKRRFDDICEDVAVTIAAYSEKEKDFHQEITDKGIIEKLQALRVKEKEDH